MTPIFDALAVEREYQCQTCIDASWPFRMFTCEECC